MYLIKNLKEYLPEILIGATIGYSHGKGLPESDVKLLQTGIMTALPLTRGVVNYKINKEDFKKRMKNPLKTNLEKTGISRIEKLALKKNKAESVKKTGKSGITTGISYSLGRYILASVF